MAEFFALVDALPGREDRVKNGLDGLTGITGVIPCRHLSHDFLIRFDAADFDVVDDYLQTHVRPLGGVGGVEVITDWDDYPANVRAARADLK